MWYKKSFICRSLLNRTEEREDYNIIEIKKNEAQYLLSTYHEYIDYIFIFRAEEVLRLVNCKEPLLTAVERAEAEELKKMDVKIHDMQIRLEQLKKKSAQQGIHINVIDSNEKKKEIVFTRNQEETIKENLGQMYV